MKKLNLSLLITFFLFTFAANAVEAATSEGAPSSAGAKPSYDELIWSMAENNRIDGDDPGNGTGFYVGRKVSADGTTLIGRTVDAAPWNGPMRETRFECGEWTYPDETVNKYAFICASKVTSQGAGFCGGGAINEKGVMLSATVSGRSNETATKADPFVPIEDGGYGEANLPDYMIGKAATAREAVEILGKMIALHGHAGAEIYMVADANEAWYVEVYTGRQWAAVRMPEDQAAVFGNQFNIREFNTNDTENVMYSPNLVGLAVKNNFAKWKDESEGIIDLYETYSPLLWDYANYRTFWGHNAWAPTAFPSNSYTTATIYPLFFDPEPGKKISLTDVFELMRTRYEGVNCPEEKEDPWIRVIGTTKQQSCHVLEMRHDLPTDYRCTLWECLAQAEHSTFLPLCMAVKTIPHAYSRDQTTGTLEYDPNRAADAFLLLDTLAETKRFIVDADGNRQDVRPYYGAGVRAYWKAQEERLAAEWPKKLAEWSVGDMNAGSVSATAYVNFKQVWMLSDAKRLRDELVRYWTEFNCDLWDGGDATNVPTYPFASSVPTNAESGVLWTQWHRTEFDAYVEELAARQGSPSQFAERLADAAKHAFDGVQDASSLNTAKTRLQSVVEALYDEVENHHDAPMPVITFFAPDFTQGPTSEVPNVFWNITGPFEQAVVTIDGTMVYAGDTRCGEGRWRDVCRPGTHRLRLAVRQGDEEVSAECLYTALLEDDDPAVLPQIGYFYPDFYGGKEGDAPIVHWRADNITSVEIWVDAKCVLVTQDAVSEFRFSQLRNVGTHIVRIMAHNVTDDVESSFAYRTESREKPVSSSAPLQQAVESAPVINEFHPDAYDASIRKTPYIHWNLGGAVDSLRLTIDDMPVFIGSGNVASGRWLDVSGLNVDAMSGSHEVTLFVSNAFGVATSNFTCTCFWEEPPPPPQGSEENPWSIGENVQVYTNGYGTLVIIGEGATSNFTAAADLPWSGAVDTIKSVSLPETVRGIGDNLWAGLADGVVINGETVLRRKEIAAGFPAESPSGAISPAEFERVDIVDGKAYLGVSVCTSDTLTNQTWSVATNGVIEVPAEGKQGFFFLLSKPALPDAIHKE